MALLYIDNFENCPMGSISTATYNYSGITKGTTGKDSRISIQSGDLSEKVVRIQSASSSFGWFNFRLDAAPTVGTVFLGFAYKFTENPHLTETVVAFFSTERYASAELRVNQDWSLSLGNLTTSPNTLVINGYAYIEVALNFDTGEFELFVNNLSVGSGLITFSGGVKGIFIGPVADSVSGFHYYDDIYLLDDTGTTHNQRLGPVRAVRVPFSTTTEANFTPFGAADNITAINKDTLNTSSFNRSPATNDVGDYFKLDTSVLPTDRPIIAVQQTPFYRKTDIGERSLKVVAKDGVNRKEMPLPDRLATFAGGGSQIIETAVDGTAWDLTKLANTDFGYEVTA